MSSELLKWCSYPIAAQAELFRYASKSRDEHARIFGNSYILTSSKPWVGGHIRRFIPVTSQPSLVHIPIIHGQAVFLMMKLAPHIMAPCLRPPFKLPEFIEATGIAKIRQVGQFSPAKGISNKTCGISTKKKPLDFTFETGFSRNQIGFHGKKFFFELTKV